MKLNNSYHLLFLFIFFLFTACQNKGSESTLHFVSSPSTFSNHYVAEGQVNAISTSLINCPQQLSGTVVFIIEDGSRVKQGDTVCVIENRELENRYEEMLRRLEQSKAQYAKGVADLEMNFALLEAQVESNEAQTSITNLDSAQLQYLTSQQRRIKELELERAAVEKEKLQKKLHYLEIINQSELRKLKIRIEQDEMQVAEFKKLLSELVMVAPLDGVAIRAEHRRGNEKVKEGDEVWNGMTLVEIPDVEKVNVLMQVSESVFKQIEVGDTVEYTFDAMPGNRAWGNIQKKAPIGQTIQGSSNVKVFDITASIDTFQTLPEVGISANAKITFDLQENSVVIPQVSLFAYDSISVVYVKVKKGYERRQVTKGIESATEVVILDGLKFNEVLALTHPSEQEITETVRLK